MTTELADWGLRLTDRLRDTIARGDLTAAITLARQGDGQTRSLASEFFLMSRGLGITVRVLIDQLQAIGESAAAPDGTPYPAPERLRQAVRSLLTGFRLTLAETGADVRSPLLGPQPGGGPTPAGQGPGAVPPGQAIGPTEVRDEAIRLREALDARLEAFEVAQTGLAEAALEALTRGDAAQARALIDQKERQGYLPLHDRLVRFMAESFGFALNQFGEPGLLRFHLDTAEGQRAGFEKWDRQSAREFTRTSAFLLKQHMGELVVTEDDEKFTIEQSLCGSGGRLRVLGAYQGEGALPVATGAGPLTFGKPPLPVYCTHCPIWNGSATLRWFKRVHWAFSAPSRDDGACTLHIYKDRDFLPPGMAPILSV